MPKERRPQSLTRPVPCACVCSGVPHYSNPSLAATCARADGAPTLSCATRAVVGAVNKQSDCCCCVLNRWDCGPRAEGRRRRQADHHSKQFSPLLFPIRIGRKKHPKNHSFSLSSRIQCVLTGWALFTNRKWRKVSFFSLDGASEAKFLYDIFHGTFLLSHHTIHH